jgi:hypothetical protein
MSALAVTAARTTEDAAAGTAEAAAGVMVAAIETAAAASAGTGTETSAGAISVAGVAAAAVVTEAATAAAAARAAMVAAAALPYLHQEYNRSAKHIVQCIRSVSCSKSESLGATHTSGIYIYTSWMDMSLSRRSCDVYAALPRNAGSNHAL